MKAIRFGCAAIAAVAAYTSFADVHADTRVGVAGAVNPSAAGTPPGSDTRQLTVGSDIQFRERVITTTDGQAQILFLDQSSLLIGPNSTVVIDEFVYDPATNKGNIAATLTQGSFRYIGGKLSKQGNATLKTPVATLGIRGSDVTIGYDSAKNQTNIVTTHGSASVETGGNVIGLRSGFGLTIGGNTPPGAPTALTAAQIAAANIQFEGQPGKNGGAGKQPTDGDVAKSGLSSTVEAHGLASVTPAAGNASSNPPNADVPFRPGNNDTPPQVVLQPDPPPPPPPPPPPQNDGRSNRLMNGYVAGSGISSGESGGSFMITNSTPTDVLVQTIPDPQGTGRVFAKLAFQPVGNGPIGDAQFQVGDAPGAATVTQSRFVTDSNFIATQGSNISAGLGKVDGANASVVAVLTALPNSVPVGTLTGEASLAPVCTCSYVVWGLWTANLQTENGTHVFPRGVWVAGVLPSVNDPSPQGSAKFSGTAIGVINSQPDIPLVSGKFTNDYNFSQRTGRVDITNFGGKSFGGTVTAGTDWRNYSGSLSGSGLTGSANGSFYGNRGANGQLQMPKETAGNFNVQGAAFKASGVFLGAR